MTTQTISFIVENKAGVLFNVTNLFRRRGFNIESIAVGAMEDPSYARMTIHIEADAKTLNQMVEQLSKMVEVIKVKRLDPLRTISRELLMVKLSTSDPLAREDALRHINNQHGLVLDIDDDSIMAEVTGDPEELDRFLEYVKSIGIVEMSRTGITALEKGRLKL
ncbi:acetolactate synthase small subunit [Candidatus Bathyarchaeota archaeon]|nr:acetolactate synthase small subunit [Candidatus Bathyarchaeota archaeon]